MPTMANIEIRASSDIRPSRTLTVDDFNTSFLVKDLPTVFGSGLVRFQSFAARMHIKKLEILKL